ncbi:MAG TPA: hypothetical protein V6D05_14685 [Stenomitos sp.]
MRKFVRSTLLFASALALALTGCRPPLNLVRPDGAGYIGTSAPAPQEPQGYGGMNVSIKWPPPIQRAIQGIPAVASTLHLKVTTREGKTVGETLFHRPATTESLVSTASLTVGVGSSLKVEVNAYREQMATDSLHPAIRDVVPTAERIIAQGTQENVTITLNATTSVRLQLDPDVTIAGKGGTAALGLDYIPWSLIDYDPRGPANWTELNQPENLVYDPVGKYLYFTERPDAGRTNEGYRIMRLSLLSSDVATGTYGVMSLVAGGALLDPSRDENDVTAPNAPVTAVRGVASDAAGNLYFSEQGGSNRIRRLAPDGTVTNFGQGVPFLDPEGLLVNGNRLFVADRSNNRVVALDRSNGAPVWTVGGGTDAGDGATTSFVPLASASIPQPTALAVSGNSLYIATDGGRVLEVNLTNAEANSAMSVRTLTATHGQAPSATTLRLDETTFGSLGGIAAGGGALYLADVSNRAVWQVGTTPNSTLDAGSALVAGLAGKGLGDNQFATPRGLLLKGATLYVCDSDNNRIQKIDLTGPTPSHFAGRNDGVGDMLESTLWGPYAIATRSVGTDLVVADAGSSRLRGVTSSGTISTLAGYWTSTRLSRGAGGNNNGNRLHIGEIGGMCLEPTSGAVAPRLYAISSDNDDAAGGQAAYRISGLDDASFVPNGSYSLLQAPGAVKTEVLFENLASRLNSTYPRVIDNPSGIGVQPGTGNVIFSLAGTYHLLLRWDPTYYELAYSAGNLPPQGYFKFAGTGAIGYNGEGPATLVQLNTPRRIRFDPQGNCYFLALDDSGQTILRRVATDGKISSIAGGGNLTVPVVGGPVAPVSAVQANLGSVADFDLDSQGNVYLATGTRILRMDQRAATMTEVYNSKSRNFTSIAFDENDAAILFTYAEELSKIKKVYLSRLF